MLCLLLDLHALSSQGAVHLEQRVLLAPIVPLGTAGAAGMLAAGLDAGLSQVVSLVSLL